MLCVGRLIPCGQLHLINTIASTHFDELKCDLESCVFDSFAPPAAGEGCPELVCALSSSISDSDASCQVRFDQVADHLEVCPNVRVECPHVSDCKSGLIQRCDLKLHHQTQCRVTCPGCGIRVLRCELEGKHQDTCAGVIVHCWRDCGETHRRSDAEVTAPCCLLLLAPCSVLTLLTVLSPLCSHCALTVLLLCSHCAPTVLSLYSHCALTVLSLCSHCALTVLSLCSHLLLIVISLTPFAIRWTRSSRKETKRSKSFGENSVLQSGSDTQPLSLQW